MTENDDILATATRSALKSVTLAAARAHFIGLDSDLGLLPARGREVLLGTIDEVIATAHRQNWITASELLDQHKPLLSTLTGVKNLTAVHPEETAQPLHRYRNAILALLMAGCLYTYSDPEHVTGKFIRLRGSNKRVTRPYRDDEIVALRLLALGKAHHGDARAQRSAATYAQVETGMVPGEPGFVTVGDVDIDDPHTAHIAAGGNQTLNNRILAVDTFGVHLMATHLANRNPRDPRDLFTYMPRKDHSGKTPSQEYAGRCASVSRTLDKMRDTLGLTFNDVTASSIYLWRVETVYVTQGVEAVLDVSGLDRIGKVLKLLQHRPQQEPENTRNTDVTSFDIAA